MKIVVTYLFFLLNVIVYSQSANDVLKKMQQVYTKGEKMEYSCRYDLFKGHSGTEVHSGYDGYVYKNGELVYQKIDQAELIYGNDFFLKISSKERAAILEGKQQFQSMTGDLEKALNECRSIELQEKGNDYVITLVLKTTSQVPYSKVELHIEKKSYLLKQMDLYYTDLEDFSINPKVVDQAQPHMRITFSGTTFSPKDHKELVSFSSYFEKEKSALVLTGVYKDYELIDNRIK